MASARGTLCPPLSSAHTCTCIPSHACACTYTENNGSMMLLLLCVAGLCSSSKATFTSDKCLYSNPEEQMQHCVNPTGRDWQSPRPSPLARVSVAMGVRTSVDPGWSCLLREGRGMEVHNFDPSPREAEAGTVCIRGQLGIQGESRPARIHSETSASSIHNETLQSTAMTMSEEPGGPVPPRLSVSSGQVYFCSLLSRHGMDSSTWPAAHSTEVAFPLELTDILNSALGNWGVRQQKGFSSPCLASEWPPDGEPVLICYLSV